MSFGLPAVVNVGSARLRPYTNIARMMRGLLLLHEERRSVVVVSLATGSLKRSPNH